MTCVFPATRIKNSLFIRHGWHCSSNHPHYAGVCVFYKSLRLQKVSYGGTYVQRMRYVRENPAGRQPCQPLQHQNQKTFSPQPAESAPPAQQWPGCEPNGMHALHPFRRSGQTRYGKVLVYPAFPSVSDRPCQAQFQEAACILHVASSCIC